MISGYTFAQYLRLQQEEKYLFQDMLRFKQDIEFYRSLTEDKGCKNYDVWVLMHEVSVEQGKESCRKHQKALDELNKLLSENGEEIKNYINQQLDKAEKLLYAQSTSNSGDSR